MSSNHHFNKKLTSLAKTKRKAMTKAEACLWKYALSKKQMLGFQFRRQRPISNFIVDFACLPLKLIIEVDGYSHLIHENEIRDIEREEQLKGLGYRLLRFKDEEVLNRIQDVKRRIQMVIEELSPVHPPPPRISAPPRAGDKINAKTD